MVHHTMDGKNSQIPLGLGIAHKFSTWIYRLPSPSDGQLLDDLQQHIDLLLKSVQTALLLLFYNLNGALELSLLISPRG